jgi:hypothetical protein
MLRWNVGSAARSGRGCEAIERIAVPVDLLAQAPHQWVFAQPVEVRAHVVLREVGIADDCLRPARLGRDARHPGDLVLEPVGRPVGLHVDRFHHAPVGDLGEIFRHRIIALDRLVGAEDARLHGADEPWQVLAAPDVVMGVDDRRHAARPPSATARCGTAVPANCRRRWHRRRARSTAWPRCAGQIRRRRQAGSARRCARPAGKVPERIASWCRVVAAFQAVRQRPARGRRGRSWRSAGRRGRRGARRRCGCRRPSRRRFRLRRRAPGRG